MLTKSGFYVPNTLLRSVLQNNYGKVLEALTLKYEPKIGMPIYTKLYSFKYYESTYCIILPRTFISKLKKYITVTNLLIESNTLIEPQLKIELYPDQTQIIDCLMGRNFTDECIKNGESSALLDLGAGRGKTMVSAGLISRIKRKTIYIVPNKPLAIQASKDMIIALDGVSIGIFSSKDYLEEIEKYKPKDKKKPIKEVVGKKPTKKQSKPRKKRKIPPPKYPDILIIVINSALLHNWIFDHYSMMILDEVHTYCSPQRRQIFKFCLPIMFGMSATTAENEKGLDVIATKELAFGGILYGEQVSAQKDVPKFTCDVEIIKYYGPDEYSKSLCHESTGILFTDYMHNQAIADPYRMSLVLNEIKKLYEWRGPNKERHLIYIFCEKLDPLDKTFEQLKAIYGEDLAIPEFKSLTGGASESHLTQTRETASIILTTYGYGGTGISVSRATAILFLTSRKAKMKQILARILRRGSDLTIRRQIRDIVDIRTPLQHQLKKRMIAYDFYEMNVISKYVSYTNLLENKNNEEIEEDNRNYVTEDEQAETSS